MLTRQKIEQVYTELITDPTALQNGKAILDGLVTGNNNFVIASMELLNDPKVNPTVRVYVAALLRSILKDHWNPTASLASQKQVRGLLPSLDLLTAVCLLCLGRQAAAPARAGEQLPLHKASRVIRPNCR